MWAFKFKFKLPFNSLVLAALLRTAVSTLPADDSGTSRLPAVIVTSAYEYVMQQVTPRVRRVSAELK